MKTEQVNLRLDEDLLRELEEVSEEEALDRATVIRRLLKDSLSRWRLDRAVRSYQQREISLGRAAEEAGLSQWELLEVLRQEGISHRMDATDVQQRLKALDEASGTGRGFQAEVDWLGERVTTLADVPPQPGGVLMVGINPVPVSVAAGHYYQGRLGRRLWARLARLGLLEEHVPGAEDEAFARMGHGLTDLVKRPTGSADELGDDELRAGLELFTKHVREWKPGLILFAFKRSAAVALGDRGVTPGPGRAFEGVPTFLLSGPYAPGAESERFDRELRRVLGRISASAEKSAVPQVEHDTEDPTIRSAIGRFGSEMVQRYLDSDRQSEAARALGMDPKRLRGISRRLGTYVTRGDSWDRRAKIATLQEVLRGRP